MPIPPPAINRVPPPWTSPGAEVLPILNQEIRCSGIELEVKSSHLGAAAKSRWRFGCGAIPGHPSEALGRPSRQASRHVHCDRLGPWSLTAKPRQPTFSRDQEEVLDLILLRWHNQFMAGPITAGSHVLLDPELRLVSADLQTQGALVGQPEALNELFELIAVAVAERFGTVTPYQPVELIMEHAGQDIWVRLTASSTPEDKPGGFYGELRQIPCGEVPAFGSIPDGRVAHALGFLDTHYDENPDLKALAKRVDLSIYHLHRLFNEHLGVSPKRYLLSRQLQVSKWLLRTTPLSIAHIAEMSGFSSSGHFSTTFHRMVKLKPIQYRDQAERPP